MGELSWDCIRFVINEWAKIKSEWAGIPLPISCAELVVESKFPFQGLNGCKFDSEDDEANARLALERVAQFCFSEGKIFPINHWHSRAKRADVWVYHTGDGRSKVGVLPDRKDERFSMVMLGYVPLAEGAWSVKAEMAAMERLRGLVGDYKFHQYLLTGMIMESSPRSGVVYLFRRLRPTIAFRQLPDHTSHILACLCLHPIGYYAQTHCGVMVPTDDVIAHITLMRGDEHEFWKQSGQHAPDSPAAGLT